MKIGQVITLKKGTKFGIRSLKKDTTAVVTHKDNNAFRVSFTDHKGNKCTTWVSGKDY